MLLRQSVPGMLADDGSEAREADGAAWERQVFEFWPLVIREEWQLDFTESDDLLVLEGIRMQGGFASCSHEPEPFEHFVSRLRPVGARQQRRRKRAPPVPRQLHLSDREAMLRQFPWLSEEDLPPARRPARAGKKLEGIPKLVAKADPVADDSDGASSEDGHAADDRDLFEGELDPAKAELRLEEAEAENAPADLAAVRAEWTWEAQDEMNLYTRVFLTVLDQARARGDRRLCQRLRKRLGSSVVRAVCVSELGTFRLCSFRPPSATRARPRVV